MAYLQTEQTAWPAAPSASQAIRLGGAERQVILRAWRDLQAHRRGRHSVDPRLEALRLYAMLGRYRRDGARPLIAAGFSPAECRIVDAMLDALPVQARAATPSAGRLIGATLILVPLLIAGVVYSLARLYLQDSLIAVVAGGLALLVLAPFANALASRGPRA